MNNRPYVIEQDKFYPISTKGKKLSPRTIVENPIGLNPGKYIQFKAGRNNIQYISYTGIIAFYNRIVMPVPDETWLIPQLGHKLYYSTSNDKIVQAGKKVNKTNPIAFGKPAVISCMFAGACKDYCYADSVNAQYWNTQRYQLHNYYLIWIG